ncbi:MAG: hypothetical protein JRI36_10725, partial [Deltaproteobacteria bacterium]|nr:hypothetical protein [Deltaproteobacteria bacterium]
DIRSHLVFQLSRALDLFFKPLRRAAGLPEWEPIVCGKATGTLVDDLTRVHSPVVLLADRVREDADLADEVTGLIAAHSVAHLSHLAIRLRHRAVPFAVLEDPRRFSQLKDRLGQPVVLEVSPLGVTVSDRVDSGNNHRRIKPQATDSRLDKAVSPSSVDLSATPVLLPLAEVTIANAGAKAFSAKRLKELSDRKGSGFATPQAFVIPFGVMVKSLQADPAIYAAYQHQVSRLAGLEGRTLSRALVRLQEMIRHLPVPPELSETLQEVFGPNQRLVMRSSANDEDLNGPGTAGVYDSVANVPRQKRIDAIRQVWASVWNGVAAASRNRAGWAHEKAHMAVLIESMLNPTFSFVLHTANPMNHNPNELYMELAVGLGQVLAHPHFPGSPYRMIYNKRSGRTRKLAFGNLSQAMVPSARGGLTKQVVDYSRVVLSLDNDTRNHLARRLSAIGTAVEQAMGGPQDIEGAIEGERIYLVQTRAQHVDGRG